MTRLLQLLLRLHGGQVGPTECYCLADAAGCWGPGSCSSSNGSRNLAGSSSSSSSGRGGSGGNDGGVASGGGGGEGSSNRGLAGSSRTGRGGGSSDRANSRGDNGGAVSGGGGGGEGSSCTDAWARPQGSLTATLTDPTLTCCMGALNRRLLTLFLATDAC
jgi:hypothetical protein